MSVELQQILEDHAFFVRAEAESRWGPDTICPGYTFDENNIPKGQCGNGRDHVGLRLRHFTAMALKLDGIMRTGVRNVETGEVISYEEMFGRFPKDERQKMEYMASFAGILGEKALMCEWGYGIEDATGRKLEDHCWLRVVDRQAMGDSKKGIITDITLDQYSTDDSLLPPILAQSATEHNGLVSYVAETSEEYGKHDLSLFRAKERIELIQNQIQMDRFEPFEVLDPPSARQQRIAELRTECLQAYGAA
jgi:hypothetical protein